jgi:SAM-dependent methyltransferase
MQESLQLESEKLVRSWAHHEAQWLRDYLVSGVEDPRINLQSILSRHFLVRAVSGEAFAELMGEEYRFAAGMNWLMKLIRRNADAEEIASIHYALERRSDNAEGLEIPQFLVQDFHRLPTGTEVRQIPNYIASFLSPLQASEKPLKAVERCLDAFRNLWQAALAPAASSPMGPEGGPAPGGATRLSLFEPACGSANDYRFFAAYGIAPRFEYSGFDLCAANIENARTLFPGVRFERGNVFEIHSADKSYDFCVIHDLLEHLSIEGMEQAVNEVCRVTRRGICVGFFQMEEIRDHVVRPTDEYHWNLLSMARMRQLFADHGFKAQVIHIGTFLEQQVGWAETHNPNAYTFLLEARSSGTRSVPLPSTAPRSTDILSAVPQA